MSAAERRIGPAPPDEAAADEALAANRLWALDDLREGMRDGRYGGRPLEDAPAAALLLLLHELDWPVNVRAFAASLPHFPPRFGAIELRETVLRLGYAGVARRRRWRAADARLAPALIVEDGGALSVMAADAEGRPRAIDPLSGRERRISPRARVEIVAFAPVEAVEGDARPMRLGRFLGAHRRDVAVLFVAAMLINVLVLGASVGVRAIYEHVIPANGYDTLAAIGVGAVCALGLDLALRRLKARVAAHISGRVLTRVGSAIFAKLIRLPLERLTGAPIGAQLGRIRQFESLQTMLMGPITAVAIEGPFILTMTLALYVVAGPLCLIPLAALATNALVALLLLPGHRLREAAHQAARTRLQNLLFEAVSNLSALRSYGVQDIWRGRMRRAADAAAIARRRVAVRHRAAVIAATATGPAATAATAALGVAMVMEGSLTIGALVGATILVGRAIAPMQQAFSVLWSAADLRATYDQVDRLLQMPEAPDPVEPAVRRRFEGALRLQRLSYRYPTAADAALVGVDLAIPAGALIAVTGSSGAGKSTLMRVLAGLQQPQAGAIFIDDVNLRQLAPSELRGVLGYAPDEAPLFHGTIAQNLRLAAPSAHRGALVDICAELGVDAAIAAMPEGYDTRLTHAAQALLPAGFRQALAMAQALLPGPRVLLLDQPATALDPVLEAAMTEALLRRRGAMTVAMVTHRPSHVRMADFELRLDGGRVERFGPPPVAPAPAPAPDRRRRP